MFLWRHVDCCRGEGEMFGVGASESALLGGVSVARLQTGAFSVKARPACVVLLLLLSHGLWARASVCAAAPPPLTVRRRTTHGPLHGGGGRVAARMRTHARASMSLAANLRRRTWSGQVGPANFQRLASRAASLQEALRLRVGLRAASRPDGAASKH